MDGDGLSCALTSVPQSRQQTMMAGAILMAACRVLAHVESTPSRVRGVPGPASAVAYAPWRAVACAGGPVLCSGGWFGSRYPRFSTAKRKKPTTVRW